MGGGSGRNIYHGKGGVWSFVRFDDISLLPLAAIVNSATFRCQSQGLESTSSMPEYGICCFHCAFPKPIMGRV